VIIRCGLYLFENPLIDPFLVSNAHDICVFGAMEVNTIPVKLLAYFLGDLLPQPARFYLAGHANSLFQISR